MSDLESTPGIPDTLGVSISGQANLTAHDIIGRDKIIHGDEYIGYTAAQVTVLLDKIRTEYQVKPFDGRSPYVGLASFQERDADKFFGRETLTAELVTRVAASAASNARALFIAGPSGSGKSSLVRAGLVPALRRGAPLWSPALGSEHWLYETLKPGRALLDELGLAVAKLARNADLRSAMPTRGLTDATFLNQQADMALTDDKNQRAVLVIDQFEEIFTQLTTPDQEKERVAFLNLLTHAATVENGRVLVIFTLRSDFVSNCASYQNLNALVNQHFIQVGAMTPDELVSAIARPAYQVGLRLDPALISQIVNDVRGEPGALPLMQFALQDLFDAEKQKGELTLDGYTARGGLHQALERHADAEFAKLDDAEKELARSVFGGLIEIGRGREDTKRTARFGELVPAGADVERVQALVRELADARLITTDEQDGKETVTLAHERLIDAWDWLRRLVDENRDAIALQNEIAQDAQEWEQQKRDESYLYRGARLATAQEKLQQNKLVLSGLAQEFVETAIKAREEAKRKEASRTRRLILAFGAAAAVFALLAVFAFFLQQRAVDSERQAQAASTRAIEQQGTAEAERANAEQAQADAEAAADAADTAARESGRQKILAENARATAETEAQIARSREVAAVALNIQSIDRELSLRLALEAFRLSHTLEADDALRQIFFASFHKTDLAGIQVDPFNTQLILSPDGNLLITIGEDKRLRVWDITTENELPAFQTISLFVDTAVFSPDSISFVTADTENTLTIWDSKTGEKIGKLAGATGDVASLLFDSAGTKVLARSQDNSVRIWETRVRSDPIAVFNELGSIQDAFFSPRGGWLVTTTSVNYKYTLIDVWDIATLKRLATWNNAMAWNLTQNGIRVFVTESNPVYDHPSQGFIKDFPSDKKDVSVEFPAYEDPVDAVFNPDGTILATMRSCTSCEGELWDATNGTHIGTLATHTNSSMGGSSRAGGTIKVVFSPTGSRIVTINGDNTTQLFDFSARKPLLLGLFSSRANDALFSADGNRILTRYSYNDSGSADLWGANAGEHVQEFRDVLKASFVPITNRILALSGSEYKTISFWETGAEARTFKGHTDSIDALEFDPYGKSFATGGADGTARVWDITAGKQKWMLESSRSVTQAEYNFDGSYLATASGSYAGNGWAIVTEVDTGKIVFKSDAVSWAVCGIAFNPTRKEIAYSTNYGPANVIAVDTGKTLFQMDDRCGRVFFGAAGKWIITANKIWNSNTGKQIGTLNGAAVAINPSNNRIVTRDEKQVIRVETFPDDGLPILIPTSGSIVSMSHDGQLIAVADWKTASVWNAATGEKVRTMSGHTSGIISISFSLNNNFIVTGSLDQTARMWDIRTGQLVAVLRGSNGQVTQAVFSPDQKYILTGSKDGAARLYWTNIQDLIDEANARGVRVLTCDERILYLHENIACPTPTPEASPTP